MKFFVLLFLSLSLAYAAKLTPVHPNSVGLAEPKGLEFYLDHIFLVESGVASGKTIIVAGGKLGAPTLLVFDRKANKILAQEVLPMKAQDLVIDDVLAVAQDSAGSNSERLSLMVLARFKNGATKASFFALDAQGKVTFYSKLNEELGEKAPTSVKEIKALLGALKRE